MRANGKKRGAEGDTVARTPVTITQVLNQFVIHPEGMKVDTQPPSLKFRGHTLSQLNGFEKAAKSHEAFVGVTRAVKGLQRIFLSLSPTEEASQIIAKWASLNEQLKLVRKEKQTLKQLELNKLSETTPPLSAKEKTELEILQKRYHKNCIEDRLLKERKTLKETFPEQADFLVDKQYREEAYVKTDASPLHLHPWGSIYEPPTNGYKQFNLASCLFGASILGGEQPLVDHQFDPEKIIKTITVGETLHPYELQTFATFDHLCDLMETLGSDDFTARYHIPVIDYMLCAIQLYIHGKMSYNAVDDYIKAVKKRGQRHTNAIRAIAKEKGVNVTTESPFNNLFAPSTDGYEYENITAESFVTGLKLSDEQMLEFQNNCRANPKIKPIYEKLKETADNSGTQLNNLKSIVSLLGMLDEQDKVAGSGIYELLEIGFIDALLDQLTNNDHYPDHKKTWQAITRSGKITRYSPMQRLLQVANISMLRRACVETGSETEVCALLPKDETLIAQAYAETFGQYVPCLAWLPLVYSYVNAPGDTTLGDNKTDNIFRFRPDLFALDPYELKTVLSKAFSLPDSFWGLIGETSPGAASANTDGETADRARTQTLTSGPSYTSKLFGKPERNKAIPRTFSDPSGATRSTVEVLDLAGAVTDLDRLPPRHGLNGHGYNNHHRLFPSNGGASNDSSAAKSEPISKAENDSNETVTLN